MPPSVAPPPPFPLFPFPCHRVHAHVGTPGKKEARLAEIENGKMQFGKAILPRQKPGPVLSPVERSNAIKPKTPQPLDQSGVCLVPLVSPVGRAVVARLQLYKISLRGTYSLARIRATSCAGDASSHSPSGAA